MTDIELTGQRPVQWSTRLWWRLLRLQGNYKCPETWNELQRSQLICVARHVFNDGNPYVGKLMVMQALTRIPMIALEWIADETKLYLTDQVAWTFDIGNITLTKQLLQHYGGLDGPSDKLANVTVAEFFFADSFFLQYNKTKNVLMLDQLVAILYRKRIIKMWQAEARGDTREAFNNNTIDRRAALIAKWPLDVKHAVLLYYLGCRNDLVAKYDMIFGDPDSAEATQGKTLEVETIYPYITLYAGKWGGVPGVMKVKIHSFLSDVQVNLKLKKQAARK